MIKNVVKVIVIALLLYIYLPWFTNLNTLSSGDWPYLFKETIAGFSFVPNPAFLWLGPYYQITSKLFVQYLNIPWELTERICWFYLFLALSVFFSWLLASKIFKKESVACFISSLIFSTNTYILMVVGGGQIGVGLSYAFTPAVLAACIDYLRENSKKNLLIAGIFLGLQVMFDPRIAYVSFIMIALYFAIFFFREKYGRGMTAFIKYIFGAGIIVLVLNSFWIVTRLINKNPLEPSIINSSSSLTFFSFGSFSQSLSLVHPNWPENIFGKTYFLKPEFLVLPILAFSSLLFVQKINKEFKKVILFFLILGLLGSFLSKGVQEPFGEVYRWMYLYIPGFILFRDPTKFYVLIVIAYSILIPFILTEVSKKIAGIKYKYLLVYSFFILLWMFLIRSALLGQLTGTFKPNKVPDDYIKLEKFLASDTNFYRTFWVPSKQRFGFYSSLHPALDAEDFFHAGSVSAIIDKLKNDKTRSELKRRGVEYIIVPYDSKGEIFIKERKYDFKQYEDTISSINLVKWVERQSGFGQVGVFKIL